jgi:hypothetical protein
MLTIVGKSTNRRSSGTPTLAVTPSSRDVSAGAQTYSLTGSSLTANVVVSFSGTNSSIFQVSTNGTTYATTTTLTPSSGTISQTLFVRKTPQLSLFSGTYVANADNASTGATTRSVALTYIEP